MTTKFQNPPIDELIITTYFNPPISDMRNEHIGIFWSQILNRFPRVSQQQPIMGTAPPIDVGNEIFPVPRYWFISDDGTSLLQVQRNAFMLNWRRRDTDYPRFTARLKPDFDEYFSKFSHFVSTHTGTSELKIDLCQLTYINVVKRCEFWSGPEDTQRVIPSFTTLDPKVTFENPPAFNCTYAFDISSDLRLVVTIRDVSLPQKSDEPAPLLIFEIRADAHLGQVSKEETDPWFERAHVAINECFLGITNQEIRRQYWKPEEDKQ